MKPNKLDADAFFERADTVAAVAPAADLFSLLSRSLKLPPHFAALVTHEAGDRVLVAPGREVSGADVAEVLFIRTSPLELSFESGGLTTTDDYLCRSHVHLAVSVVLERSEAESFRDTVMGSRRVLLLPSIVRYLDSAVRVALGMLAEKHEVEDLVDGKCRDEAAQAVRQALATLCFQAGLELTGNVTVTFHSEALDEVRATEALTARRLDEHAAQQQLDAALTDARAKHLAELESTLQRLKALATESPDAAVPDLLRTFKESERAKLYQALFESERIAPATQWLVAASGQELLFFAPESCAAPVRRTTLEGDIGPLRSIQAATLADGRRRLFAGAARGVYELGVEGAAAEITYAADAAADVRGGVNSVALFGDWIFATHSELGLLRWARSRPNACTCCLKELTRPASAVRNMRAAADRLILSVDDLVVAFQPDAESERQIYSGSTSTITAALTDGRDLFAGNADGQILHWPDGETTSPHVLHGGSHRPAESIALITTGGVPRLFYTDTTLAVFSRVLGDTFTCRYEAGGQTLRRVDVAADLIVATNDQRDRLLIWRPNRAGRPIANSHVARLTGHTIQDVTLVPLEA